MDKSSLRIKYKKLRAELSEATIAEKSLEIANRLLELDIWSYTYYHIFLSIVHHREIQTDNILHILQGKDKSVIVPKANFETGVMTHILLQEHTRLKLSDYGIPEPVEGLIVDPTQIEVVFIPLLAYDQKGNRLGYGKGFYDRFLSQCRPECVKVGLSLFEPEPRIISDVHDVSLDHCVTPSQIYNFK
ncbi:MAG: 5-formyltetrahydrofolate cyclo-ligase [Flavobacteriaceae bacterium]|nr:5-formyltetrahydrofolate cyclo-ligase [Flavobacteriaceae bacterium]